LETCKWSGDAPTLKIVCQSDYLRQTLAGSHKKAWGFKYLLDDEGPEGRSYAVTHRGLQNAVETVREERHYGKQWFDDTKAKKYHEYLKRERIFARSIEQDFVLFKGKNLIIYAICMEVWIGDGLGQWFSEPNMKENGPSEIALIHMANQRNGRLMVGEEVYHHYRNLGSRDGLSPDYEVYCLNAKYREKHGHEGIVAKSRAVSHGRLLGYAGKVSQVVSEAQAQAQAQAQLPQKGSIPPEPEPGKKPLAGKTAKPGSGSGPQGKNPQAGKTAQSGSGSQRGQRQGGNVAVPGRGAAQAPVRRAGSGVCPNDIR
jgi:hypothetical protein